MNEIHEVLLIKFNNIINIIDWVRIIKFDDSGDFILIIIKEIIKFNIIKIFIIIQYIF